MGKTINRLNKQIESTGYINEAKDCMKIYNYLKSIDQDGKVWGSDWQTFIHVEHKDRVMIYKPNVIGYTLLTAIQGKTNK